MGNIQKLSPAQEKLHLNFKYCGSKHLEFRQKCIGQLPQIFKEKIYAKIGFASIDEYAAKLAGLSQEQVKRALSLDEKFSDLPALKNLLETGEVSINKLAKVASIATTENQEILADKVRLLPCRALETLVRDERAAHSPAAAKNQDGLQKPLIDGNFVHVNKMELQLSEEVKDKLMELQRKGIDINDLILQMLQARVAEIEAEKEEIAEEVLQKSEKRKRQGKKPSRYIQVKVRNILIKEHGTKCSIPSCNKPAKERHHTQRYALAGTNDPRYMAPLCEEHHIIAQTIDIKYWQVRMQAVT